MALTKVSTDGVKDDAVTADKVANAINTSIAANTAKDLTALSASNLTSGTVPDARFPATLPAKSAANLTNIPAGNLTGTVADARISALTASKLTGDLPAISGANLTGISTTPADGSITQAKLNFPVANRNLLINGNFSINQRGGVNTSINTYALDRWRSYGGPLGFTISQQNNASNGSLSSSRNAIRVARNSGNSQTSNTGIAQGVETLSCQGIAGTQMTLSFFARKGADFSSNVLKYIIFFGQGTDDNPVGMTSQTNSSSNATLATTFTKYTKTVTVPANTSQITVAFAFDPTGTAGSNDWFEIAECQLERGSVATSFEHKSHGQELLLCQRYFWKFGGVANAWIYSGIMASSSNPRMLARFPVAMRAAPTITFNDLVVDAEVAGSVEAISSIADTYLDSVYGGRISLNSSSSSVGTGASVNLYPSSTSGYIQGDAEL